MDAGRPGCRPKDRHSRIFNCLQGKKDQVPTSSSGGKKAKKACIVNRVDRQCWSR